MAWIVNFHKLLFDVTEIRATQIKNAHFAEICDEIYEELWVKGEWMRKGRKLGSLSLMM